MTSGSSSTIAGPAWPCAMCFYGMLPARKVPMPSRTVCGWSDDCRRLPHVLLILNGAVADGWKGPAACAERGLQTKGDISKGHCNNGWIIFQDFVLVIDANFPSGAREHAKISVKPHEEANPVSLLIRITTAITHTATRCG